MIIQPSVFLHRDTQERTVLWLVLRCRDFNMVEISVAISINYTTIANPSSLAKRSTQWKSVENIWVTQNENNETSSSFDSEEVNRSVKV